MKVAALAKSCTYYCLARILTVGATKDEPSILLGSNYGARAEPNLHYLAKAAESKGLSCFTVGNASECDLVRGSFKSFLRFFNCTKAYYTHSLSDVLPHMHRAAWLVNRFKRPKLIFLQHGVIALKQDSPRSSMTDYVLSLEATFDKMCSSMPLETEILNQFGVPRAKIANFGLPRFDGLSKCNDRENILVFLTWSDEKSYQRKLSEIFTVLESFKSSNPELSVYSARHEMLSKEPAAPDYAAENNLSMQQRINRSSLLITDISSIAWDYLYKGDQVVFYQPEPFFDGIEQSVLNQISETPEAMADKIRDHLGNTREDAKHSIPFYYHGSKQHSQKALDV